MKIDLPDSLRHRVGIAGDSQPARRTGDLDRGPMPVESLTGATRQGIDFEGGLVQGHGSIPSAGVRASETFRLRLMSAQRDRIELAPKGRMITRLGNCEAVEGDSLG